MIKIIIGLICVMIANILLGSSIANTIIKLILIQKILSVVKLVLQKMRVYA